MQDEVEEDQYERDKREVREVGESLRKKDEEKNEKS